MRAETRVKWKKLKKFLSVAERVLKFMSWVYVCIFFSCWLAVYANKSLYEVEHYRNLVKKERLEHEH